LRRRTRRLGLLSPAQELSGDLSQVTETDTAQPITPVKPINVTLSLVTETDSARTLSPSQELSGDLNQVTETDVAQPITPVKPINVTLSLVTETDEAQPLTPQQAVEGTVNQATETDAAQPITPVKPINVTLSLVTETDVAQPLTPGASVSIGQATETDTAQPLTPSKSASVGQATETDEARPLSTPITLGQVTETDTALPLTPQTGIPLGQASETDVAQSFVATKTGALNRASESDEALPMLASGTGTLTAAQLSDLRDTQHEVDTFVSFLQPRILWSARVNNGSAAREDQTIPFDGGSGLDFSAIAAHQTVWVGSTAGAKDIGIARVKSISSGNGGVSGTLVVGANPLIWDDNLFLTFMHDYRLWAVFPRIAPDETFYKDWESDGGITYTDENSNILPAAIAGPHQAGFLSSGSLQLRVPTSDSYALAVGASIVSRSCSVYPTTGVTVSADGSDYLITYTQAGQYWVKVEVTDSNGKTQDTYRSHFIHSDDPGSSDYPFTSFSSLQVSCDWDQGGWEANLRLDDNASLDDIPDETLAIVWQRAYYGDNQRNVSIATEGANTIVCGYVQKDDRILVDLQKGSYGDLIIASISLFMKNHFMYSVSIASEDIVDTWWKFQQNALNAGRIIHHLYRWHSTIMHIVDVEGLLDVTSPRRAADIERGGLYEMGDTMAQASRQHIIADKTGRLRLAKDIALDTDANRNAYTVIAQIENDDTTEPVVLVRNPQRRVSFVFASGFSYDGGDATPLGATSPSTWPSPFGAQERHLERLIIDDQSEVNELSGQVFARENRVLVEVRVDFQGNYLGVLEIGQPHWWEISVPSTDNVRGLTITDQKLAVRGVSAEYNLMQGTVTVKAYFEPEVDGEPGVPYQWPDEPGYDGEDGQEPDLPLDSITAIITSTDTNSMYMLGDQDGTTWSTRNSLDIKHFGKDPFYLTKTANPYVTGAIVWICAEGAIYRSTSAGSSPTDVTPSTNPPNDYGDSPAPTPTDLTYITYRGSYVNANEHVFLAIYRNGDDKWRTWVLHTNDDGTSWTWISLQSGASGGAGWQETIVDNDVFDGSGVGYTHHPGPHPTDWIGGDIGAFNIQREATIKTYSHLVDLTDGTLIEAGFKGEYPDPNFQHCVVRLDDYKFAVINESADIPDHLLVVIYESTDDGASWNEVAGDTINPVGTGAGTVGNLDKIIGVGSIDSDSFWVAVTGSSGGTRIISYRDIGGITLDQVTNTEVDVLKASEGSSCRVDGHTWHLYYKTASGLKAVRLMPLTGGAVEVGTAHTVTTTDVEYLAAARMDDQTSVCYFRNNDALDLLYGICCELSSASGISQGSVTLVQASEVTGACAFGETDGSSTVVWRIDNTVQMRGAEVNMAGIDGLTPILQDAWQYPWTGGGWPTVLKANGSTIVGGREEDDDPGPNSTDDDYVLFADGTDQTRGIWMDLAKGDGETVYVTAWNGSGLSLFIIDLTTDTVEAELGLGTCTAEQLENKEYIAYPLCLLEGDDAFVVYGRMNNPIGLGETHSMASGDRGESFIIMDTDWGNDHAGAAIQDDYGFVYFVRNRSGQSPQLYNTIAGAPSTVLSTIPANGYINPGGLAIDWDFNVIVLSGEGQAKMVQITWLPYTEWLDLTGNHGTNDGTAVEVI
jgi:hypothetical protein